MIQVLIDFYKKHKYAVIWTGCYVAAMWAVLLFLFHFNMFSANHWHHLANAHLHGFPGFVFGILLLAAVPLYTATTTIIVRTGKPLFTIKWPTIPKAADPAKKSDAAADPTPAVTPQDDTPLPDNLPGELRPAFRRARKQLAAIPQEPQSPDAPAENTAPESSPAPATDSSLPAPATPDNTPAVSAPSAPKTPAAAPISTPVSDLGDFPLPDDFNFDDTTTNTAPQFSTPVFSDINFDTPQSSAPTPNTLDSGAAPTPQSTELSPLIQHLESTGRKFDIRDDVIICNDMAITAHTDTDFWIADDPDWFAAGKQKKSPARVALDAGAAENLTPVLYLGSKNIMDIDDKIAQWSADGLRVVTDLSEI